MLHRSVPLDPVDYFRWLTCVRMCHKCHLVPRDPQNEEQPAHAHKASFFFLSLFFFFSKCPLLHCNSSKREQTNNQSYFFTYFSSSDHISLLLLHDHFHVTRAVSLLHEIDAGLHLNKSLLFCQTFMAECNILTTRRLQILSHCSVSVHLDAWTICRLIIWFELIWYLFLIWR